MDQQIELRSAVGEELLAAAEAARDAVLDVDDDQEAAVHAFRKALRRARAVLSLVSPALPSPERRAARRGLREARRALGSTRDLSVAPQALAALELDDHARVAANAVFAVAANAAPGHSEIAQALAEGAARAAAQVEIVVHALPLELDWSI